MENDTIISKDVLLAFANTTEIKDMINHDKVNDPLAELLIILNSLEKSITEKSEYATQWYDRVRARIKACDIPTGLSLEAWRFCSFRIRTILLNINKVIKFMNDEKPKTYGLVVNEVAKNFSSIDDVCNEIDAEEYQTPYYRIIVSCCNVVIYFTAIKSGNSIVFVDFVGNMGNDIICSGLVCECDFSPSFEYGDMVNYIVTNKEYMFVRMYDGPNAIVVSPEDYNGETKLKPCVINTNFLTKTHDNKKSDTLKSMLRDDDELFRDIVYLHKPIFHDTI